MSRSFRFTASEDRILERCEALVDCGLIAPIYEGVSIFKLTTIGYLSWTAISMPTLCHGGLALKRGGSVP